MQLFLRFISDDKVFSLNGRIKCKLLKSFLNIFKKLKPYRKYLLASIVFNFLTSVFTIAGIPLFIPFFELIFKISGSEVTSGPQSDSLQGKLLHNLSGLIRSVEPAEALKIIVLLFILTFLLKNVFRYLSMYFMAPLRNGFIRDLRKDLFDKLLILPVGYFKSEKKGDLLSRMSVDIQEVENSILAIFDALIKAPILIMGSLVFMFFISYKLTLMVLLLMPFTVFIIGGLSRRLKRQSGLAQQKLGDILSVMEETISGIKVIKAYNAEKKIAEKFKQANNEYSGLSTKIYRRRDSGSPLAEVLAVMVIAVLMFYAGSLVFSQKMLPQTFFAFIYAFFIIIEPAKSFSAAYFSFKKGDAAMNRLEKVLTVKEIESDDPDAVTINEFKSDIFFDRISFNYPENEQAVLQDFSLRIRKGEKIALVGDSGAGKTTVTDLLLRFIEPTAGTIFLDGIPMNKIRRSSLRALFGLVTQEAVLFNDSLYNNISMGDPEAGNDQLWQATSLANIDDFVESLPKKLESLAGEQGGKLSGGQKQRIAIARALIKNAPVLILDEATSALDSASEKKVHGALKKVLEGKTALIIAHRLSTIREADKIIVLKQGKIIETGNHDELMAKTGEYYKFVRLQSLKSLE